jgi:predicted nucleic acid-binding protein
VSVCLDAFALLAWLRSEPGADLVEGFLNQADGETDFNCFISLINLGEVYYRLCRLRGGEQADAFWEDARRHVLPLSIVGPTQRRVLQAAQLKARYPIAFADAFAVQLTREMEIPLVSGDPEIKLIEAKEQLRVIWLPI